MILLKHVQERAKGVFELQKNGHLLIQKVRELKGEQEKHLRANPTAEGRE